MLTEERLVKGVVDVFRETQKELQTILTYDRKSAFQTITLEWKDKTNITRAIDLSLELRVKTLLWTLFENELGMVVGEESLSDPDMDLRDYDKTVALLDVIDGTDLLVRDLSNWCSAIAFFQPNPPQILATFIADALGRIYFATKSEDGAYMLPPQRDIDPIVLQPSSTQRISDSFLCFYGQKQANMLSVTNKRSFLNQVHRIYNLGGNPMLAKVAEGTVDGVFELIGQLPHDVIPGLFIAKKAGAVARSLEGEELDLELIISRPAKQRMTYIVASTEGLYQELKSVLTAPEG